MSNDSSTIQRITVVYDGYCGFCYRIVRFIETHDSENRITLLPRQSDEGAQALRPFQVLPEENESVLVIADNKLLRKSDATIRIWQTIGGIWSLLSWQRILPGVIRDWLYDIVANNRYKLFGKYDSCQWPKNKGTSSP